MHCRPINSRGKEVARAARVVLTCELKLYDSTTTTGLLPPTTGKLPQTLATPGRVQTTRSAQRSRSVRTVLSDLHLPPLRDGRQACATLTARLSVARFSYRTCSRFCTNAAKKMPPVLQEIIIVTVFPCRARRRRFPSLTAIRMASRHPRNLAWARAYLGRICPTHAHASERRSEEIRV